MLARMLGAARLSVDTYEDVEHDNGATIQALAVVIIVSIASIVGELLGGDDPEVVRRAGRRHSAGSSELGRVGAVHLDDRGDDTED